MKVKELIEELEKFDENMEVVYDFDNSFPTGELTCLYQGKDTVKIF